MSRSFTARQRGKLSLFAIVAMLIGLLPVVFLPGGAQASCAAFTVHGTARNGKGTLLRSYAVAVFLPGHQSPLAHSRASRTGGYSLRVCKGMSIKRYASHHGGYVQLSVKAHAYHKASDMYDRHVAVRLGAGKVAVRGVMKAESMVDGSGSSGGSRTTTMAPTAEPATVYDGLVTQTALAYPPAAYVPTVPFETTRMTFTTNSSSTVEAEIGAAGDLFQAAGSAAVGNDNGFVANRKLSASKSAFARLARPEIQVSSDYHCVYSSWYSVEVHNPRCGKELNYDWTGIMHMSKATYHGCSYGSAPILTGTNKNTEGWAITKGVSFTGAAKVGFMASSLRLTTKYDRNTLVSFNLRNTTAKHHFCLGGNGKTVPTSNRLYLSNTDGGGTSCQVVGKSEDPNGCTN